MRKKYQKLIQVIFIILSIGWFSWGKAAESKRSVRVGTLSNYQPFCFQVNSEIGGVVETLPPGTRSLSFQGYAWDVVRESFHAMGYTVHLRVTPWARVMHYADSGRVDLVFSATRTASRLQKYYYSQEPILMHNFLIYVVQRADWSWNGVVSLRQRTIGTVQGWSYGEKFDVLPATVRRAPSPDIISGFRKLLAGRLDGVVGYELSYDYALKKAGLFHRVKKMPVFARGGGFLIGAKTLPHSRKLLRVFDQGIERLKKNGRLRQITQSWRGNQ